MGFVNPHIIASIALQLSLQSFFAATSEGEVVGAM
jgi:hypothetical protein